MKCDNIVIKLSLTLMIKNIIICLCTCALFAGVQVCSCKRRRNVTACAVQYMDNNKNNVSRKASGNTASVVAIIVVGIFVLCVILLLAKGLFASNSSEVPKGINTATINTNESVAEPVNSAAPADTSVTDNSSVDESGAVTYVSSDESSQTDVLEVMYVTEYAYLHVAPDNDAENIVCMSPGVQVNVLEYEDNGYVKINFMNIDGPLTGYIYKDYLTTDSSIAVQW